MADDFDFFADAGEETGSEGFRNKVTNLVREIRSVEREINKHQEEIKNLNLRKNDLETKEIPDAMMEAGVSEFTTVEGLKVTTKLVVGAIPGERKAEAFQWLEDNGHSDIIKREVQVSFDKGSQEAAETAAEAMRAMGLAPKVSLSVHAQTFMSFAREQINNGKMLPLDKWGVFHGTKAVIK